MPDAHPGPDEKPLIEARWPDLAAARAVLAGAVVAIGNFDGVHLGHLAVLAQAKALGESLGRPCGLVTFEPHPRDVFRPDEPIFRLTDAYAKARLVAHFGFGKTVALAFDADLSGLSAEAFIADVLVHGLQICGAVVGPDFRFGKGRGGDVALLTSVLAQHHVPAQIIAFAEAAGQAVSSSMIRSLLEAGEVAKANAMLGYRWSVRAEVQHGDKRGRLLGFPTANLHLDRGCRLKHGIYAVRARMLGRIGASGHVLDGVASFGSRPTFDGGMPKLEVFLFDFNSDLYGHELEVEFIGFIRPEMKFDTVDTLVMQMQTDTMRAKDMLEQLRGDDPCIA
jgi:riboflavin kinase / FMN adenylyltransferase